MGVRLINEPSKCQIPGWGQLTPNQRPFNRNRVYCLCEDRVSLSRTVQGLPVIHQQLWLWQPFWIWRLLVDEEAEGNLPFIPEPLAKPFQINLPPASGLLFYRPGCNQLHSLPPEDSLPLDLSGRRHIHGLSGRTDQPTKHAQYEPPRSRGATQFAGVNTQASRAFTKRAQNGISGLRLTRDTGDRGTTNQLKRPVRLSQSHTTREQINVTQEISSTRSSRWGSSDGNLDVTWQTDFQLNPPSLLEGLWLMQIWSQHLSTWSQPDDWMAKRVQQRAVEVATNLKPKSKAQGDSNQDARQKRRNRWGQWMAVGSSWDSLTPKNLTLSPQVRS